MFMPSLEMIVSGYFTMTRPALDRLPFDRVFSGYDDCLFPSDLFHAEVGMLNSQSPAKVQESGFWTHQVAVLGHALHVFMDGDH
jgi:hypothetical protein